MKMRCVALIIDGDLRKSLSQQDGSGTYVLRPTARMEPDTSLGTIAGEVSDTVITNLGGTTYTGSDIDTGCAAYTYAGYNTTPDDYYAGSGVVNTASVKCDTGMGIYRYAMGAVVGGTAAAPAHYTVAVTCDADDPEADDNLDFTSGQNADVVSGETSTIAFLDPSRM